MNYMEQIAKMLGVELYEEFNIDVYNCIKYRFTEHGLECFYEEDNQWVRGLYIYRIFTGEYKIIKIPKPILDEAEKEYLSAVINPFKDTIDSITKYQSQTREWILIEYNDEEVGQCGIFFPVFKSGEMYKGMKAGKHYTLEELGL